MDRLFGDKHESDATIDLSFAPGDRSPSQILTQA